MKRFIYILILLPVLAFAQKRIPLYPGKDSMVYYPNMAKSFNPQAGDTVLIMNKGVPVRGVKLGYICAPAAHPVIVMLQDSLIPVGGYSGYSFVLERSSGVVLDHINVDAKHISLSGIAVELASDITLRSPKVRNVSGIGIRIKTDPKLSEAVRLYPYFMANITIDGADVENTGAEGGYLGHSLTNLDTLKGRLPVPLQNLTVTNWHSRHTGWDGLQISNSVDVAVHNVDVQDYGYKKQVSQMSGFTSGGSVTYRDTITNINISTGPGSGWCIFSRGRIIAKHIRTYYAGMLTGESGIYIDDFITRFSQPAQQVELYDVEVIGAAKAPLFYYNKLKTAQPLYVNGFKYSNTGFGITDNTRGTWDTSRVIVPPVVDSPIVIKPPVDSPVVITPPKDTPVVKDDTLRITVSGDFTALSTTRPQVITFSGSGKVYLSATKVNGQYVRIENPKGLKVTLGNRWYFTNGKYRLIVGWMMGGRYKTSTGKMYIVERRDFSKKK